MGGNTLTVISLGAGVQSTTMALMAAHGKITPMPDYAIFADTQWEPKAVYDHLAWLRSPNVLPFPVHVVSAGNIRDDILARRKTTSGRFATVPWFTINSDNTKGMGRRQCTNEYKLTPLAREMRRLLGAEPRQRMARGSVEVWIGISTDEAGRMKPARQQWIKNRWPLIDAEMNRNDCLRWLERNGYPAPPKSSCVGCPFHSDHMWREIKNNSPDEWADAVIVDAAIRQGESRGIRGVEYMHRSCVPLDQVDLSTAEDRGQLNLFMNECEGICGV